MQFTTKSLKFRIYKQYLNIARVNYLLWRKSQRYNKTPSSKGNNASCTILLWYFWVEITRT